MQFYGDLKGNRGEATRGGSKDSGIRGHIRGWNVGGLVSGWYNPREERDEFTIYATTGSSGQQSLSLVDTLYVDPEGKLVYEGGLLGMALDALVGAVQTGRVPEEGLALLERCNRVETLQTPQVTPKTYRLLVQGPVGLQPLAGAPRLKPRYVTIPSAATLKELHEAVYNCVREELTVMRGYDEDPWDHMHSFGVGSDVVFSDEGDKTTAEVPFELLGLQVGDKLRYTYDLGACWQFMLVLKKADPSA